MRKGWIVAIVGGCICWILGLEIVNNTKNVDSEDLLIGLSDFAYSQQKIESDEKKIIPRNSTDSSGLVRTVASNAAQERVPDVKAVRQEISYFSNAQIADEIALLKSDIYERDLIDRLNHGQVSDAEQNDAQAIFDRLVVLGIEKTERALKEIEPDLEKAIAQHEQHIKNARKALSEDE